jgi:hypothetical protein
VDSPGSGYGSLAGSCECGDEPSGSGSTELVSLLLVQAKNGQMVGSLMNWKEYGRKQLRPTLSALHI